MLTCGTSEKVELDSGCTLEEEIDERAEKGENWVKCDVKFEFWMNR